MTEKTNVEAINAVAVKLSPFSTQEPISWFRRAEIQFRLRKITDERTKADYVLESLPESVFPQVSAWLDDQTEDIKYNDLKAHLLEEFTLTPSARAQRLLQFPLQPLGDRTPQQAWNEMQALARLPNIDQSTNEHERVDLMCELWLQTLPKSVRAALPEADTLKMPELLKQANNLVNAAKASQRPTPISAVPEQAAEDISAVRHKSNQSARHEQLTSSGICFYHKKFGASARKCSPGCEWTKN